MAFLVLRGTESAIFDIDMFISFSLSTSTSLAAADVRIVNDIHLSFSVDALFLMLLANAVHGASSSGECFSSSVGMVQRGFLVSLSFQVSLCRYNVRTQSY